MAKKAGNKYASKSNGVYYVILLGVIILLIGFYVILLSHNVAGGAVLLLIGILISILGLSHHSLHILKRRVRRA